MALRSDTPEQVDKAIAALEGDTRVYKGTYAPVDIADLQILSRRYYRKAGGLSGEPLIGDTSVWREFANRVTGIIQEKIRLKS